MTQLQIWVNWILGGEAALTPAIMDAMQQGGRLTVSAIAYFEVHATCLARIKADS